MSPLQLVGDVAEYSTRTSFLTSQRRLCAEYVWYFSVFCLLAFRVFVLLLLWQWEHDIAAPSSMKILVEEQNPSGFWERRFGKMDSLLSSMRTLVLGWLLDQRAAMFFVSTGGSLQLQSPVCSRGCTRNFKVAALPGLLPSSLFCARSLFFLPGKLVLMWLKFACLIKPLVLGRVPKIG